MDDSGKSRSSRACLKQVILPHTQASEDQQDSNDCLWDQIMKFRPSYSRLYCLPIFANLKKIWLYNF